MVSSYLETRIPQTLPGYQRAVFVIVVVVVVVVVVASTAKQIAVFQVENLL